MNRLSQSRLISGNSSTRVWVYNQLARSWSSCPVSEVVDSGVVSLVQPFWRVTMASRSFSSVGIVGALATVAGLGFAATAMATPVLNITTSSGGSVSPTLTSLGGGAYAASPGTVGGFTWGRIDLNVSSGSYDQLALQVNSVANSNPQVSTNATITFSASESGLSASPNSFLSIQGSGSVTATGATSSQTADIFGSAVAGSGTVGIQNSGALSLKPSPGYPSTSVGYTSLGQNLSAYTGTLTLNTSTSLTIDSGMRVNGTDAVMNLNTTTVGTPEPATMGLFAVGGLALLAMGRRRMA